MNHTNDLFWNQNGEFRRKVTSLHPCTTATATAATATAATATAATATGMNICLVTAEPV